MKIDLIVTRHNGLLEFLQEKGLISSDTIVLEHISDPTFLEGKVVCGVLPVHLAAMCKTYVAVDMNVPLEKRGQELSKYEVEKYCTGITAYTVNAQKLQ